MSAPKISTRRNFLKILGGGTIVAAAGIGTFIATRTPHKALQPWQQAGQYDDPRKAALSYALLAPNPHNRQPWSVDLSKPDTAIIYRDRDKNLPHTDPYDRQLTIGMGCFLELMVMAAAQQGYSVDLDLFPQGEDGPIATARFEKGGATPDPLFAQVMNRRSCKEPFEAKSITQAQTEALAPFARIIDTESDVSTLRKITLDAWMTEANTPRTLKESVDLFRIGKSEINANPDGIDLGGPFLESLALAGVLTRESQLDTTSQGFQQGVDMYTTMLTATPNYALITSAQNSREDQIAAGRQWLRLNLKTAELGLALHPVSQALQEFEEMKPHYDEIHQRFAKGGETIQMLGRVGYGPSLPVTPRWPLESKIRES